MSQNRREFESGESTANRGEALIPVNFQFTPNLVEILQQLKISLVVSTYQAGKVLVIGTLNHQLSISFLDYDRPMGVAVSKDQIAVGAGASIHFLSANHDVARTVQPAGAHDGAFVPRESRHTGKILVHDLGWGREGLWVVNTLFSCLCTLDQTHSFVPRWKPSFISRLADEDRCHLNGMAMEFGQPRIVSALSESDTAAGWRKDKARTGCLIDVESGELLVRGLCMPHSPRIHNGELFVLNSGHGNLSRVDRSTGQVEPIEHVPGYTRGLVFHGQFAFVGLSRIRETNVFGGLPIGERSDELCCGIAAIDMTTGRTVATFRFLSGVEEIFAVEVVPGFANLAIGGANHNNQQNEIWVVPGQLPLNQLKPVSKPVNGEPSGSLDSSRRTLFESSFSAGEDSSDRIRPTSDQSPTFNLLLRQAVDAHNAGRLQEALSLFQSAQQQNTDSPELLSQFGNLYQDLGNPEAAFACYQRSLDLQPLQPHTQRNLAILYSAKNQPLGALHHLELAQQSNPHPMNFMLAAKVLPVIYDSAEQVSYWRNRLTNCLDNLVQSEVTLDTTDSVIPTSFYFAYQGHNDRPLMERLAKIYQGVQCCDAAKEGGFRPRGKKIRVGFMSAYFCQHTIGRLNLGVIERLPREQFEVTVIALNHHNDKRAEQYRAAADRFVEVPRQPARARRMIAELGLDILIFADVGMDCLSQTLCYSRMAPIQAVTWGHPDTTGSPAIDYFISTDLAEAADAQDHYSETLIRLPSMGVYYNRPVLEGTKRDKSFFGLDENRRVYLCPQTLFKFHPDFDQVLKRILERDPDGDLVLIRSPTPEWNDALLSRWRRVLPDADRRIKFLPSQPRDEFLHLLSVCDAMLDPFPFCGGNTSYEAIAVGTPVVTLPDKYLRGRLTYGMYQRMQFDSTVARSVEHYVELALRLANDREFASRARQQLQQSSGVLYGNLDDVMDYAAMLTRMVEGKSVV